MQTSSYKGFSTVALFFAAQILSFTSITMLLFIGSFIGSDLAPHERYATLPLALIILGTAVGVAPITLTMQKMGRRWVFFLAFIFSSLASTGISLALAIQSFELFCFCTWVMGMAMASASQFRFAAMESVLPQQRATATSMILLGGVVAAFMGPELAMIGKNLTAIDYQGSFYIAASCHLFCALLLCMYSPSHQHAVKIEQHETRPLTLILGSRSLWLAIGSAAIGYAGMSFIMTATPISMHHIYGHDLASTKHVIQGHIAAMFLPSLITPFLILLFGLRTMIMVGIIIYMMCMGLAFMDTSVWGFTLSLILLGIGWNFLFVSGTSMLPEYYQQGEQFKVQAFNDAVVFSVQAAAALLAGIVLNITGWKILIVCCLPMMTFLYFLHWYSRPTSLNAS